MQLTINFNWVWFNDDDDTSAAKNDLRLWLFFLSISVKDSQIKESFSNNGVASFGVLAADTFSSLIISKNKKDCNIHLFTLLMALAQCSISVISIFFFIFALKLREDGGGTGSNQSLFKKIFIKQCCCFCSVPFVPPQHFW